jgi:hypothetical protein
MSSTDRVFLDAVVGAFDRMLAMHPNHVFRIMDKKHAMKLFEEGRLADETVILAPVAGSSVRKGERDNLAPMKLSRVRRPRPTTPKAASAKSATPAKGPATKVAPVSAKPIAGTKYLVWESKPLSERDLSIPRGAKTNPTGSMGFKKGLYGGIDHQHYFRDEVFNGLEWKADAPGSKKQRATANFELVIKNISYGNFNLTVAHSTDTTSASYLQRNFTTQLHWGAARALIAKRDLLGRNLYLYRKDSTPPEFMIEID